VREVLEDGITGYIVSDLPSAIEATRRAQSLDRRRIRRRFEERFSARRMAKDYVELYQKTTETPERLGTRAA
jgi:glycosyltransferase involved in cell wall biosynthesis